MGSPSFYGKKGLKAQRGWCWVKDKSHISVARSGSVLGNESVGSIILQKSSEAKRPVSVCYIYI
jgi:hypothetical protein